MLHYLLCVGADCTASNQETRRLWWQSPPLKEPSSAWSRTARRQSCIWPVVRLGSHGRHQSPWLRILYWRASEREHSLVLRRSLLERILTRLRHVQNFNHYAFVKLSYGRYEFAGTAKLLLCLPQAVSAYHIEGLGQVSKGHKEVAILLMAFFTYSRVGNFGQSVILQVKGELNHFYWSRSVRYFLSSK